MSDPAINLSGVLTSDEYTRQRVSPTPTDSHYIPLSDIRQFLTALTDENFIQLLDYGCGGSPYRNLFKCNRYIRADYVDCGNLDFFISSRGKIALPNNACDGVISTQVLEHVFSPRDYLSEAFRVLRPGGKLIITTHGIWEDHPCPHDFRRWTAEGLCSELIEVGFSIKNAVKLTTGPRAVIFLFAQHRGSYTYERHTLPGLAFWLLRYSLFSSTSTWNRWADRRFPQNRVVNAGIEGHGIYLGLGVEALKP